MTTGAHGAGAAAVRLHRRSRRVRLVTPRAAGPYAWARLIPQAEDGPRGRRAGFATALALAVAVLLLCLTVGALTTRPEGTTTEHRSAPSGLPQAPPVVPSRG